jgi:hypothetical protein
MNLSHKYLLVISTGREHGQDGAPTARRMPARGNTPGIVPISNLPPRKGGGGDPAPLQGASQSMGSATQGVALGWHAPAPSAPETFDLFG